MKGITKGNASAIGFVSTLAFAGLIWWYVAQGTTETTIFIVLGALLVTADIFALWCMPRKVTNNKRGKK